MALGTQCALRVTLTGSADNWEGEGTEEDCVLEPCCRRSRTEARACLGSMRPQPSAPSAEFLATLQLGCWSSLLLAAFPLGGSEDIGCIRSLCVHPLSRDTPSKLLEM